jgi:hypothetical protein
MLAGMERTARSLFADSIASYEGLEIVLRENMAERLQSPALHGRDVQYAQNG